MCVTKSKCRFPEKLKNKDPKDCSPKPIILPKNWTEG